VKQKILLVEDSEMSVVVMKKEIELLGYECIVALDGKEAIKKASEYLPDLIVMDILLFSPRPASPCQEIGKNVCKWGAMTTFLSLLPTKS